MTLRLAFIVEAENNVDIVVKYDEALNILTIEQDGAWITVPADVVEDLRRALSEQASDLEERRFEIQNQPTVSFSPAMQCGMFRQIGDMCIGPHGSMHEVMATSSPYHPCVRIKGHSKYHQDVDGDVWKSKENV